MAVHAGGALAGQQDLMVLTHLVALDLHDPHLDDACQLLGQDPAGSDSTSGQESACLNACFPFNMQPQFPYLPFEGCDLLRIP